MYSWNTHARARRLSARRFAPTSVADALLKITDLSLAGLIVVAPLLLGGRHDFGRFVFALFVAIAAASWLARQAVLGEGAWPHRRVHWLLGAATLMLLLQLAPLPPGWLQRLSPRTAVLLPLWTGAADPGELGQWRTLSLAPEETRLSLAMLAAYILLFVTVSQRIESRADVARLLKWIGLSAVLIAALGLLQAAVPNGRFLWIYDHPTETTFDRLSGPFANRNHFAHFLVLGAASLAALWFASPGTDSSSRPQPHRAATKAQFDGAHIRIALLTLVLGAILLSGSRGGAIATVVAAAVFGGLMWRAGRLKAQHFGWLAACGAAAILIAPLIGFDGAASRLSSLSAETLDEIDEQGARRRIWSANVGAIKAGGWFGAGAGSHRDVYPMYMSDPPAKEHTHADNGYLQIATENGLAGVLLLAAALGVAAYWCIQAIRHGSTPDGYSYAAVCSGALAASVVHSAVDFVWYIPACLTVTIILAACAMRLGELGAARAAPRRILSLKLVGTVNIAAAATIIAAFSTLELFRPAMASIHWDAYLRVSNAQRELAGRILPMPPTDGDAVRDQSHTASAAALESMIGSLEQAVAWRPRFAAAHRQLASRYLELYHLRADRSENPMPAPQVREAAIASQFPSAGALNSWLQAALGDNSRSLYAAFNHARIAAQLSPLQGSPYVRLAALSFLQGHGRAAAEAYLRQALLVRPYDGDLLFEVGADLCVCNHIDAGLDCWSKAFRIRGDHRIKIARAVAGSMPFKNLLELFQPEWDALPEFWRVYRNADDANVAAVLRYATEQAEQETAISTPLRAAVIWRRLAQIQLEASHQEACLASLHRSHAAAPDDYSTRRMLAMVLVDVGRPEQAAPHLRWCQARQPHDARVAEVLSQITRDRLSARPSETAVPK
jgi:O-antigen ligase